VPARVKSPSGFERGIKRRKKGKECWGGLAAIVERSHLNGLVTRPMSKKRAAMGIKKALTFSGRGHNMTR